MPVVGCGGGGGGKKLLWCPPLSETVWWQSYETTTVALMMAHWWGVAQKGSLTSQTPVCLALNTPSPARHDVRRSPSIQIMNSTVYINASLMSIQNNTDTIVVGNAYSSMVHAS
jgi:hypothetical protein